MQGKFVETRDTRIMECEELARKWFIPRVKVRKKSFCKCLKRFPVFEDKTLGFW
jgi:hypothetical protein